MCLIEVFSFRFVPNKRSTSTCGAVSSNVVLHFLECFFVVSPVCFYFNYRKNYTNVVLVLLKKSILWILHWNIILLSVNQIPLHVTILLILISFLFYSVSSQWFSSDYQLGKLKLCGFKRMQNSTDRKCNECTALFSNVALLISIKEKCEKNSQPFLIHRLTQEI